MVVPYASIASAIEGVAKLSFTIYTAWKDAPTILQRVSRELRSVYLLLEQIRTEAEDPNSTINRYGDHKKTDFQTVVTHIKTPLEFLYGKAQNYKQSGRSAWQRILIGGFAKDQIKDSLDEILHHVSYLQMLHLSLSDGERYLRLDNYIDAFCQNEVEKEEVTSTVFSLEGNDVNPDEWEELWEVLLPKLQQLHYESDDMQNHKKEILAYINYKTNVARENHGIRGRRQLALEREQADRDRAEMESADQAGPSEASEPLDLPQISERHQQDEPPQPPSEQTEAETPLLQEGETEERALPPLPNPSTADPESQSPRPREVEVEKKGANGTQTHAATLQPPAPVARRQTPGPIPRKAVPGQSESFELASTVERNSAPIKKRPESNIDKESPGWKAYLRRRDVVIGLSLLKLVTSIIGVSLSGAYISHYRSADMTVPVTPIGMVIIFSLGIILAFMDIGIYADSDPDEEDMVPFLSLSKALVLTAFIVTSFVLHPKLTGKLSDAGSVDLSPGVHIAFTVIAMIHWIINMFIFVYVGLDGPPVVKIVDSSHPSSTANAKSTGPRRMHR